MRLASCIENATGFPSFVHNYNHSYDSNYSNVNFNDDQIDVESIFFDPSMDDFSLNYSYPKKPISMCEDYYGFDDISTQHLKRQNCNNWDQKSNYDANSSFFSDVSNSVVPEFNVLELPAAKKNGGLSAQSEAARKRRRKISEKTKELGKVVPGGSKMNTAEMLDAAFKYVKYMQAQIQVLKFIPLFQVEKEKGIGIEEMKVVSSPRMQEKLYMENRCLVPRNIVTMCTT